MTDKKTPSARTTPPIEPYSDEWQRIANSMARDRVQMRPCQHCQYPVIDGYCCDTCGASDP